jgi:hypothetical protein
MKKVNSILMGVVLVFVTGAVMATGNLKVDIRSVEKQRTMVDISNVVESIYEVELKNMNGDIVYYKKSDVPSAGYRKYFDFSKISEGEYNLTVSIANEKKVNTLKITKGQVELVNQRQEVEPFFTVKGNRLELSYLNFAQEDLKLMVYSNNILLFEKNLNPDFSVNYALDFSKLISGKYNAVLAGENSFYEYNVIVK